MICFLSTIPQGKYTIINLIMVAGEGQMLHKLFGYILFEYIIVFYRKDIISTNLRHFHKFAITVNIIKQTSTEKK